MARMRQQLVTDKPWTEGAAMMPPRAAVRAASHVDVLRRAVEQEVIPRLLMARAPRADAKRPSVRPPSTQQVMGLVDLLLTKDAPASASFVDAMRALGTPSESLYLDLLTPAARRLGVMWEEDTCGFSDVTLGLLKLHSIMRALQPDFMGEVVARPRGPRALLVQMPGEQHGLGLGMLVQFFRRAGWNVWNEPVATSDDLVGVLRHRSVAMVGISLSCSERLDALAADIRAIRRASRNPRLVVMVGGPAFLEHPQLAAMVGADATASDAPGAVRQARTLVSAMARDR